MNDRQPRKLASEEGSTADERRLGDEESRVMAAYGRRSYALDAQRYTYFNEATLIAIQNLERAMLRLLRPSAVDALASLKLLEVGCGAGFWLRQFVQWGASPENLTGIDLLADQIAEARRRCPAQVELHCAGAARLAFSDESFDVVLQSTVFSSILDAQVRLQVANEMTRVLKPGGFVLWYDFHMDNPRNPDVRGVKRREIVRLFPKCQIELRRITLAPPIARRVAPYSGSLCRLLAKVPPLCTHYIGTIRRR